MIPDPLDAWTLLVLCPTCGIAIQIGGHGNAELYSFVGAVPNQCANCGEWFSYTAADLFNDPHYREWPWVHWMATFGERRLT